MTQLFAAAEVEGIAALGIDPLAILAQTVTFLTLFYVVKKFALDKIVAALQDRYQKIDDGVRLGYKMEKEMARLESRIDEELRAARSDADEILREAHQSAGGIIREAEDKAAHKVDQMIQDAHRKIEHDIQVARDDLRREMVEVVVGATEAVLDEKLDSTKDAALVERAIAEVKR